jgi:hypothetical protein
MRFDTDLNSEHAELFLATRRLIMECIGDGVSEKQSKCITSYFAPLGGICYIKTESNGIRIGWFRGIRIKDNYNLLSGNGKTLRGHTIKTLGVKEQKAIQYYVRETISTWIEDNLKKGKKQ